MRLAAFFAWSTAPALVLYVVTILGALAEDGLEWIIERRP